MFLFWRLVLSHVLGDFPLQTATIYSLKVKTRLGSLVHGLVFIILNLLLGWPYLGNKPVLGFFIAMGLIHAAIDGMKISFKGRYSQGENIISFISDQLIHLAVICLIIPFRLPPPEVLSTHGLASLYYNDTFIFFSIGYVFVSYGGTIFSAALKNTFAKTIIEVSSIPLFEKAYGFIERLVITILVASGFNAWPVAVAVFPRLIPPLKKRIGGFGDLFINYCLSLVIGLLLRDIH